MNYFLIILFLTIFGWLCFKDIKWAVFTTAVLLPVYLLRFSIFGLPLTLLEAMIWILFISWLIKLSARGGSASGRTKEKGLSWNPSIWFKNIFGNRVSPARFALRSKRGVAGIGNPVPKNFRLPIVLLLISSTIAVFTSANLLAGAGLWKAYFIEALLFFIVFIYNLKTAKDLQMLIRFLGLTVIIIGIFAVIQKFTGLLIDNPFWQAEATRRITTFYGYPNANSLFVVPIILLSIGNLIMDYGLWIINNKSLNHKLLTIISPLAVIFGTLIVIFAKSAGGLIGLTAGIMAMLIFFKKTRLMTLISLALILLVFNFTPQVKNEIRQIYISTAEVHLSDQPSSWQIRIQQWRETLDLLKDRPILGAGLAGYQLAVEPYHQNNHIEIFLYPHNFFLNFWIETGLLGLISIIYVLLAFFRLAIRLTIHDSRLKILTFATMSAMIALLVHGLVDVPYFKNDLSVLFWIIIGILIVIYNQEATNKIQDTNNIQFSKIQN